MDNFQSITWDEDEKQWYRDGDVGEDGFYDERWEAEQAASDILAENGGGKVYVYNKKGGLITWYSVEADD